MLWIKFDIYLVTEMRDNAIYKTRKVDTKWMSPEEAKKLEALGTHLVVPTNEIRLQKERP